MEQAQGSRPRPRPYPFGHAAFRLQPGSFPLVREAPLLPYADHVRQGQGHPEISEIVGDFTKLLLLEVNREGARASLTTRKR